MEALKYQKISSKIPNHRVFPIQNNETFIIEKIRDQYESTVFEYQFKVFIIYLTYYFYYQTITIHDGYISIYQLRDEFKMSIDFCTGYIIVI